VTELDPLPSNLASLLSAERDRPDPSGHAADRLLARVQATLALPPDGGGGPGGDAPAGAGPAITTPPPAALAALAPNPLVTALVAFALGAAAGAGAMTATSHGDSRALAPRALMVATAARVGLSAPAPALSPEDLALEAPAPSAAPAVSAAPARDVDLARERSLLGRARTALAKREARAALGALDRHAREFPSGRLAEERESLRVQALVLSGDRDAAQAEARAFEQKYPKSLLSGAMNESLKTP
jgi:hypothetical protein